MVSSFLPEATMGNRSLKPGPMVPPLWKLDLRSRKGYIPSMTTTLFMNGRSQAVRLPREMRLEGKRVSIRKLGDGVLIEPITCSEWPPGYFDAIRVDDPEFRRVDQGTTPPAVDLEE